MSLAKWLQRQRPSTGPFRFGPRPTESGKAVLARLWGRLSAISRRLREDGLPSPPWERRSLAEKLATATTEVEEEEVRTLLHERLVALGLRPPPPGQE